MCLQLLLTTDWQVLEADDLEPVLDVMKQNLMAKNVAAEIADDICSSVRSSLEGKKLASLTRYMFSLDCCVVSISAI